MVAWRTPHPASGYTNFWANTYVKPGPLVRQIESYLAGAWEASDRCGSSALNPGDPHVSFRSPGPAVGLVANVSTDLRHPPGSVSMKCPRPYMNVTGCLPRPSPAV